MTAATRILGIDTSCDETAVAVVEEGRRVLSARLSSQIGLHAPFGGVVPEIASRRHLETLFGLLQEVLEESRSAGPPQAIAVTQKPGLIGALLVGVSAAKALAYAWRLPLVGVDHVHAHAYSTIQDRDDVSFPLATLVVSGGHTSLFLMRSALDLKLRGETVDDAAGEAFDKVASLLELGYPGGPAIDKAARRGNPHAHSLPRGEVKGAPFDFSFSGLKTAVRYHLRGQDLSQPARVLEASEVADLAASFQEAVVEALLARLLRLAGEEGAAGVAIGGGVAANTRLRERAAERAHQAGLPLYLSPRELATDNAVMVAGLGFHVLRERGPSGLDLEATPH
ncbi:MAG: tRNA (adenosine(37)-N6)-threonylcarbamoyltransferase complex transferase subunit TsaD [Planctomycetota bacterium]